MGKGEGSSISDKDTIVTWKEVKHHTKITDRWIVINCYVYDVTRFQKTHPGGAKLLGHYAGQDATQVWTAMHREKNLVEKYMRGLCVGKVEELPTDNEKKERNEDFENLRITAERMGWFNVDRNFFLLYLLHLVLLEILAYLIMSNCGTSVLPYLLTAVILTTSQGASKHWWNFRHMQHHAKTNVFKKDPDITLPYVFLLGDKIPVKWGMQKRGIMPYQYEHLYFWLLGPAALLPVYFHIEILYFVFKRRDWSDFFLMVGFFVRHFYLYGPLLGGWGAFGLYMFIRFMESFWFTFVTQMSHLPMDIDTDQERDWLVGQTVTTCNIQPGVFNDWFSGHLNFQIEHHLFPTMPRHNYHKVAPLVKSLCEKHHLPYTVKPLGQAFADVLRSLKKSGQLWYDAYYNV